MEKNEKQTKRKVLKYENHTYSNKKEGEKVLYPFKRRRTQRFSSIVGMIIGALFMISSPIIKISNTITLSGFIAGLIIFFVGLLYFLDVQ